MDEYAKTQDPCYISHGKKRSFPIDGNYVLSIGLNFATIHRQQ